jgi:hypothetical protein
MPTKKKKKLEVDFSDEESVAAAMASELDVDVEDINIEEDRGLSSFGVVTVYRISLKSGRRRGEAHEIHRHEYLVVESDDAARELAIAVVKQDLEEEPENFNQDFIQQHIDKNRLRRDLHSDVYDMNYEHLRDEANTRPMKFVEENSLDMPEPTKKQLKEYAEAMSDEDNPASAILAKLEEMDAESQWIEIGEEPEVEDSEVEKIAEGETERRLEDPMAYLEDIYGPEDAAKKAIEIAGIDIDAAAEEAVSTDGEGHFLSRYDGNMQDGPGGIVYWRES